MPSSACSAGEGSGLSVAAGFASGGGAAGFCSQGWGPGETAGFALGCGFFYHSFGLWFLFVLGALGYEAPALFGGVLCPLRSTNRRFLGHRCC